MILVEISSMERVVVDSQGDVFHAHQAFGVGDFVAALLEGGVGAVGTALVADFRQALGLDRQAEQLAPEGQQRGGQGGAVEILGDERVVGGLDGILHRKIKAGGRLAAAGDPHQNHVSLLQPLDVLAIVVCQTEIDGFDAVVVLFAQPVGMRAAHGAGGRGVQDSFEPVYEGPEQVEKDAGGGANVAGDLGIPPGC
ncbi:hypothetical protein CDEF62S_05244 [Castellaniella defragrans]